MKTKKPTGEVGFFVFTSDEFVFRCAIYEIGSLDDSAISLSQHSQSNAYSIKYQPMVWRRESHTNGQYSPNHRRILLFQPIGFIGHVPNGAGVLRGACYCDMGSGQFGQFPDHIQRV
ncbi:hypothetical protein XENE109146_17770 [Xenorhabdus nematophila]